ncbi:MAG: hypothetical protein DPW09_04810 [Anaerolineae bacterium]|nr:hypothetical protein [Anaerolineales bacterium]MCQ3972752.1 hypothetical protein [Anaerolineae bacterium]
MKRGLLIIGIVFAVTFGVVFGTRVSADALAVIVGVVLGILAGIPTTLLAVFIMTRQRSGLAPGSPQATGHPPVVVINAADRTALTSPSTPPLALPYPSEATRRWTVIGDVDTES